MNKNMKLVYGCIIVVLVFCLICLLQISNQNVEENISKNNSSTQTSGESFSNLLGYDVEITEDTLVFTSPDGVVIVYSFDNDHLVSIVQMITANDNETAEYIKQTFEEQITQGVIESAQVKDNIVSLKYNMEYFAEYENYTKDEIQNLIFNNENVITNEKGD